MTSGPSVSGECRERLEEVLAGAARSEPAYLDFLDALPRDELASMTCERTLIGIQISHFTWVKTLGDIAFKYEASVDAKLVHEIATGGYIADAENGLLLGLPGVAEPTLRSSPPRQACLAVH